MVLGACKQKPKVEMTPWGTPLTQNNEAVGNQFRLRDILSSGELIMLTLSGPDTYYDYHGEVWDCSICCARNLHNIWESLCV